MRQELRRDPVKDLKDVGSEYVAPLSPEDLERIAQEDLRDRISMDPPPDEDGKMH